jgi:spermidine synthase
LTHRLASSSQATLQAVLLLGGLAICWWGDLSLPLASATGFPPLGITWYLTTSIGLPAIVLGTTSPLLQFWLAPEHGQSRGVYRWFAVSNLASLTALFSYPWLIQPLWSLSDQWAIWRAGFTLYCLCFGGLALRQWRQPARPTPRDPGAGLSAAPADNHRPGRSPLGWWLLSFGPAVLLMAVSNQITADLSAGPLLWVWPLGLYLLTYTLAFAWPMLGDSGFGWLAATVGGLALLLGVWFNSYLPAWLLGSSQLGGLFFLSLLCHSYLVRLQPATTQLTQYYWMIAVGGWSGGLIVSCLAPWLLDHYYELELAVFLCWWSCLAFRRATATNRAPGDGSLAHSRQAVARWGKVGRLLGTALISLACLLGLNAKYPWQVQGPDAVGLLAQERTFFGVLRVEQQVTAAGRMRTMGHGSTDHGRQLIEGPFAQLPTGYYSPGSGLAAAVTAMRQRRPQGLRIAVLGLGAGNLVHWMQPADRMVFYEIDPAVARFARAYFPNLDHAAGSCSVRIADGRLGLQQDAAAGEVWDLIVMDAFTGDAVPTHLLTEEAWQIYLNALAPDGIIAVHISNRYIDLEPVLRSVANRENLESRSIEYRPWPEQDRAGRSLLQLQQRWVAHAGQWAGLPPPAWESGMTIDVDPRRSHWVLVGRHGVAGTAWPESLGRDVDRPAEKSVRWTDDFAPLWPLLK